jgi:hypothetical protein
MAHLVDELKNRARILHRQAQASDPSVLAQLRALPELREQNGGYLLAYRWHFFIVEPHFITNLGLDPDDPDWERIGRDWAKPRDPEARERLYAKLIRARVSEVLAGS